VIQSTGTGVESQPNTNCFGDAALTPAPSMLYVLMDRSSSMRSFIGPKGLKQVLDLSLQDPSLLSTQVGFKFMPAAATDCAATQASPNPFAALSQAVDVPFLGAEDARLAIAVKVGADTNLLAAPDGPVYLDAALRGGGAYQALLNARQPTGQATPTRFNRQAVLVVGNRDFSASCPGASAGQTPADFAKFAFEGPAHIATYAVVLGRVDDRGTSDTTDDVRPDQAAEIAAADALAAAGGTTVFNATKNPAEGYKALTTVVNDLSSCLYQDVPELTVAKGANKLASYGLSYLSFGSDGSTAKVDVPFNATCNETSIGQSGWNLDATDNRVRLCGDACTSLRDSLLNSSLFAAISVPPASAPGIPIRVRRPCE
jgi:hypothetical protein